MRITRCGPTHSETAQTNALGHNRRRLMRSSKSRSRNKSNRQRSIGNIINRVFDSSGPEGKVRGTPQQIIEKYLALARDAQLGNDRVAEQNFLQHAEHYTRMLGEAQRELAREQEERQRQYQQNGNQNGGNGGNQNGNREPREPREPREAGAPDVPRYEEPRYEGAPAMMPELQAVEDDGPGLVETPEAQVSQPRAADPEQPAAEASEAKPAKAPRPRTRKPKPKAEKPEGGEAPAATVNQDE